MSDLYGNWCKCALLIICNSTFMTRMYFALIVALRMLRRKLCHIMRLKKKILLRDIYRLPISWRLICCRWWWWWCLWRCCFCRLCFSWRYGYCWCCCTYQKVTGNDLEAHIAITVSYSCLYFTIIQFDSHCHIYLLRHFLPQPHRYMVWNFEQILLVFLINRSNYHLPSHWSSLCR